MCKFCLYKHVSFVTLPKLRHPIFQITTEKISPQTSAMKPIFSKIRSKNKFSQRTQLKNQASGRVHKSPQNVVEKIALPPPPPLLFSGKSSTKFARIFPKKEAKSEKPSKPLSNFYIWPARNIFYKHSRNHMNIWSFV